MATTPRERGIGNTPEGRLFVPTFDVTIQGKQYHVEIPDPGASPLQVIVDGQPFDVQVAGTSITSTPVASAEPRAAAPRPAPQPTPLPPLPNVPVARPVAPVGANGGHDVVAPMPGTIISIEVKPGQQVEVGQVVCVLEAMKMKNPIRVNVAACIAEVMVQTGQSVAYGDVLVRLA
jgi:glutaconyl-CoA/methylmalonyl-CoA decarboxylase subunit gamma